MKRNYIFNKKALNMTYQEANRKIAIHEAGHAAAICLGNKQRSLPPIFFQIYIIPGNDDFQSLPFLSSPKYIANIDGGRLIHTLPSSIEEAADGFSPEQIIAYQRAFEADMINILVGPLAEAKYVALSEGAPINPGLIRLNDLHDFGGTSDLESINEYLECFPVNSELRQQKITELFWAAFSFINEQSNWRAINALADYIVNEAKNVIECNEIIDLLETFNNDSR